MADLRIQDIAREILQRRYSAEEASQAESHLDWQPETPSQEAKRLGAQLRLLKSSAIEGVQDIGGAIGGAVAAVNPYQGRRGGGSRGAGGLSGAASRFKRGYDAMPGTREATADATQARADYAEAGGSGASSFLTEIAAPGPGEAADVLKGGLFLANAKKLRNLPSYSYAQELPLRRGDPGKLTPGGQKSLDRINSRQPQIEALMTPEFEDMGRAWHNQDPVYQSLLDQLPEKEAREAWDILNDAHGAGSAQSPVPMQIRRALYMLNAHRGGYALGNLDPPSDALWGNQGFTNWYKSFLGTMGRSQNAAVTGRGALARTPHGTIAEDRTIARLHPWSPGKPSGGKTMQHSEALRGNRLGTPLDRHVYRSSFLGEEMKGTAEWAKPKIAGADAEAFQIFHRNLAPGNDMSPAQSMAWQWAGGAELTGLKADDAGIMMDQTNRVIDEMADAMGKEPKAVWDAILNGELPVSGGTRSYAMMDRVSPKARKAWYKTRFVDVDPADYVHARGKQSSRAEFLTPHTVNELDEIIAGGGKVRMSEDGKLAYVLAMSEDGTLDIGGVFSLHDKEMTGIGMRAVEDAMQQGGETLDAFEMVASTKGKWDPLTAKYGDMSFVERFGGWGDYDGGARAAFDPTQAAPDFEALYGRPPVVLMESRQGQPRFKGKRKGGLGR